MKNRFIYIILILLNFVTLKGQIIPLKETIPGLSIWYTTEFSEKGKTQWKNMLQPENEHSFDNYQNSTIPSSSTFFNYNPALYFNGYNNGIRINLDTLNLAKSTIFTVFHPKDSLPEQFIWGVGNEGESQVVLTSHRLADLNQNKFMNFVDIRADIAKINTYFQHKKTTWDTDSEHFLQLGKKKNNSNLPLKAFKGVLPEILVFNRVLTMEERLMVESYLALKYGLTIRQGQFNNFINSKSELIWDGKKHITFSNDIAGIGRDDRTGLNQKQSSSFYSPELLTIGAGQIAHNNKQNTTQLKNNSFLIWGSNINILDFEPKKIGQPQKLERKWIISSFGAITDLETQLIFDTKQIKSTLSPEDTYWLIIDRSGSGDFPLGKVAYKKINELQESGKAEFKNILWNQDESGTDLFTIASGPEMMSKIWITSPTCNPEAKGRLSIGAEGGRPPYKFIIVCPEGNFIQNWESVDNSIINIENIDPGDYELTITDADNQQFNESFFIQSSDAPVSKLDTQYELILNRPLHLDASINIKNNAINYQWTGPDGFYKNSAVVEIKKPGEYDLTMEHLGCESKHKIKITQPIEDVFKEISLYPNPISKGPFNLRINLLEKSPIEIDIFDSLGRSVMKKSLKGADYYLFSDLIYTPGTYSISVSSNSVTKTLSLIVN